MLLSRGAEGPFSLMNQLYWSSQTDDVVAEATHHRSSTAGVSRWGSTVTKTTLTLFANSGG